MRTTQLVLLIFLFYQHCPPLAKRRPPQHLIELAHFIRVWIPEPALLEIHLHTHAHLLQSHNLV